LCEFFIDVDNVGFGIVSCGFTVPPSIRANNRCSRHSSFPLGADDELEDELDELLEDDDVEFASRLNDAGIRPGGS